MQIVSIGDNYGDNLHEMANCFLTKKKKKKFNMFSDEIFTQCAKHKLEIPAVSMT